MAVSDLQSMVGASGMKDHESWDYVCGKWTLLRHYMVRKFA